MSVCEHNLVGSCESATSTSKRITEEKFLNIQNELKWGLTYRNYKENEKKKPMLPMHSPINIPFELCRAEMMAAHKQKMKPNFSEVEMDQEIGKGDGEKADTDKSSKSVKSTKSSKKRKLPIEKPTLLDRNVWPQSKYMDFLSIPNPKFYEEPKQKKYKKRCELEPCPPRFIQLAVPNKRRVFANWKDYAHFLPAEMLLRYEELLHTDQNLEPREARYYYKTLDRKKRKEQKRKRRLAKKKKMEQQKDADWVKAQIDMMANEILDYIKDEPLFTLNYKQLLLSDSILERLEKTKIMKKPSRKIKNPYKKTIVDVSDKLAIWIDTLTRFVDVQAIESEEDLPPVSISTLSGEYEGEEESEAESEYEYSSDEDLRDDQLFEPTEAFFGEEDDVIEEGEAQRNEIEGLMEDLFKPGEGEDATDLDNMLKDLDGDILEKLIKILSNCSDDFLDSDIDSEKMPDIKYRDVLDRLKDLHDGLTKPGEKPFLEQVIIDWAIKNDPDNVNDEILRKIHEVSALLGDFLGAKKTPAGFDNDGEETEAGEEEGTFEGGFVDDEEGEEVKEGIEEDEEVQEGIEEGEHVVEEDQLQVGEGDELAGAEDIADEKEEADEAEDAQEAVADETEGDGGAEKEVDSEGPSAEDEGEHLSQGTFEFNIPQTEDDVALEGDLLGLGEEELDVVEYGYFGMEHGEGEEAFTLGEGEGEEVKETGEEEPVSRPPDIISTEPEKGSVSRLDGRIIKGHKPPKVFEHNPDTVCCLSLKTWAVWLLEITHNAHNWTKWMSCVIQKVKEYAAIVRGDIKDNDGKLMVLRKAEWRKFTKETEESVIAWRQYSAHVKDLSQSIMDNFHDKKVNCCPKCLQDHLITNVVVAHDTLQALTEAISCAAYWQRCLDSLVEKAGCLTQTNKEPGDLQESDEDDYEEEVDLEEVENQEEEECTESVYEIEGLEQSSSHDNAS